MANQERVDMKSESNIIVEFFFSASGGRRALSRGGFVLCYLRLFSCSLAVAAKCNGCSLLYVYDNAMQSRCCCSTRGSKGYPLNGGYEPTGKDLKCQYNYRFQIEGYNHNQARMQPGPIPDPQKDLKIRSPRPIRGII